MKRACRRGVRTVLRHLLELSVVLSSIVFAAGCATTAGRSPTSSSASAETSPVIEESIKNLGIASPHSLLRAENMLGESTAGYSNRGLELSYVVYKMIQILYPLYLKPDFAIFPPSGSIYPGLFKKVEDGTFPTVNQNDVSFLTLIIPPLAVLYTNRSGVVESSLEALDHAETLNPNSVLPPYLKGYIYEKQGKSGKALTSYDRALSVDSSCYPAAVGKARVLLSEKRYGEANTILKGLVDSIPPDATVFHLEAQAEFARGSYDSAQTAIVRSLNIEPKDAEALILSAKIYDAQKAYGEALKRLAAAEKLAKPTADILLMQARLERANGNPSSALDTLAAGVEKFPDNRELASAYGKALIESGQAGEGSKYLTASGTQKLSGTDSLELLVANAIDSKDWKSAETYVSKLLLLRSDQQTWEQAYKIYGALDEKSKVAEYARKLHTAAPEKTRFLFDYIRSLISLGKGSEARSIVNKHLSQAGAPDTMSTLYYLRSQIQSDPAARLADLRSALLENLENEEALVAIARYYLHTGDTQSARMYAMQAKSFLEPGKSLPQDLAKLIRSGR